MTNTPERLTIEQAATLTAAITASPDHCREHVGGMEYIAGMIGAQPVAVCIDLMSGEGLRL